MAARSTLNVSLTPQLLELLARRTASGRYRSASEVIREALRLLDAQDVGQPQPDDVRALIDGVGEGFYAVDRDWRITLFNEAAARHFTCRAEEALGANLWRLFPGAAETELGQLFLKTMETRQFVSSETPSVIIPRRRLSYRLFPFRDGLGVVFRDVTELRQAEEDLKSSEQRHRTNEERLRLAAAAAGLGLFEIDWQTRQRFWSPELCSILRVPADFDVSQEEPLIGNLLPEPFLGRFRQKIADSMRPDGAGDIEDEHLITRFDGSPAWIHLRGKTYFDDTGAARRPTRTVGLVMDITERRRSEEGNALLASVVRSSSDAIFSVDAARRIRSWNDGAERLYGYSAEEAVGAPLTIIAPEHLADEVIGLFGQALQGEEIYFETVRRHKAGTLIPVGISAAPIRAPDGRVVGLSAVHRDISDRKRYEEHITFTMRELSHRTKNVLAVVQAMARQIGAQSKSIDQFQERLAGGVQALAYCHDLLIEHGWEGAALDELVRLQLSSFGVADGARLVAGGPAVFLRPHATQLVGLALHELATNAAKYGALSNQAGVVHVIWRPEPGGGVRLRWSEEGGPKVSPPKRKGFGHTVLHRMAAALDGETSYEMRPEGVVWTTQILERHIWPGAGAASQGSDRRN